MRVNDFKKSTREYQREPLIYVDFDQAYYTNPKQALIYGSIALVLIGPNRVMALPDTYDFDIRFNLDLKGIIRDVGTLWGAFYNQQGTPYVIRFIGTTSIRN